MKTGSFGSEIKERGIFMCMWHACFTLVERGIVICFSNVDYTNVLNTNWASRDIRTTLTSSYF